MKAAPEELQSTKQEPRLDVSGQICRSRLHGVAAAVRGRMLVSRATARLTYIVN